MSVTILEVLENAYFNLVTQKIPGISDVIGAGQLRNAITLLEKGYDSNDDATELIEAYDNIEDVPNKSNPTI